MLIQMFSYGLLLIVIGSSIASLFLLLYIIRDQMDEYVSQLEENAKAQASINVLQMRPHFIYNTLTSIYYLCEQDPKKAMEMIDYFTNYLRKNFTAIAKNDTIPFKEELEHVRTYLAIEKVRFEGKLFVKLDTPHTNFRIPPLTLQPIVENSVKYGIDPELDPLYISVVTNETENGSEIIVTDNGPGFNEDEIITEDNSQPHVAINNIRKRLSMMCDGSIWFSSRDGGGTVVRIFIPNTGKTQTNSID
jgi:sensor histidine kinase YesM